MIDPRSSLRRGILWVASVSALLAGCGANPGGPGVEVSFASGMPRSVQEQAVLVEVYLVSSCDGVSTGERPATSIASTHVLREGGGPPLGDDFDPGEYGLYALAKDANCAVVAAGCASVSVSADQQDPWSVTISASSGQGCSIGQQCDLDSGDCVETGDGGVGDGGPPDPCVGAADEMLCTVDDQDGLCRTGACCVGCWDGTTCRPGNQTQSCGTGGELCEFVPGCS